MTGGWIKSHIRLPIKNGQYRVACAYGDNESLYEADANYFTHDKRFANPVTGANMTSDVIAWFEIPPFEPSQVPSSAKEAWRCHCGGAVGLFITFEGDQKAIECKNCGIRAAAGGDGESAVRNWNWMQEAMSTKRTIFQLMGIEVTEGGQE